jgi:hypothetical protein
MSAVSAAFCTAVIAHSVPGYLEARKNCTLRSLEVIKPRRAAVRRTNNSQIAVSKIKRGVQLL